MFKYFERRRKFELMVNMKLFSAAVNICTIKEDTDSLTFNTEIPTTLQILKILHKIILTV